MKLAACGRPDLREFTNAFWPLERPPVFQPEPGCSESTFTGSGADLAGLAASSLNLAAVDLAANGGGVETACAHLIAQPHVRTARGCVRQASLSWSCDITSYDASSGYHVRIARKAWRELEGWTARAGRLRGSSVETGGILFGERNDACRVIWVDEVIGPPPDSRASSNGFECGTAGVVAANEEKSERMRRSVEYIGMWHTHPDAAPVPSQTDREGMARLTSVTSARMQKALLVIVGTLKGRPSSVGAYVFERRGLDAPI